MTTKAKKTTPVKKGGALIEQRVSVAVNPEALIKAAIDNNLDVEKIEKILAMRRELKAEYAREEFFRALSAFQSECPIIEKKKKVYDKNNKLRYKYAAIEDIISQVGSLFEKHGFSYFMNTPKSEKDMIIECHVNHVAGHTQITTLNIPVDSNQYMNNIQRVGSAVTYGKRMTLCAAFGIVTNIEDDDGLTSGEPGYKIIDSDKPAETIEPVKGDINTAPDENAGVYKTIMALLRERNKVGKPLFSPAEKADIKKNADAVLMDIKAITAFYKSMNKRAKDLRGMYGSDNN